jgi:hypothetical protein
MPIEVCHMLFNLVDLLQQKSQDDAVRLGQAAAQSIRKWLLAGSQPLVA